ncbi:MAG: TraX family protein [Saccharofermentanales bacterium]|jgi:hypothetical protein|nr:TraX family protein [Bacillota bacterium]NLB08367.1 hypothetical protein [Clostridiales bacterium]
MLLKLIAAISMLIDHIGYYFGYWLPPDLYFTLRALGRLAFPIFAFYIALGYRRTGHLGRYFLRLTCFAVLSEIIIRTSHSLAGYGNSGTNVLFTFVAALGFLSGWTLLTSSWRDRVARLQPLTNCFGSKDEPDYFQIRYTPGELSLHPVLGMILGTSAMIISLCAVIYLDSDYDIYGILTVFIFHLIQNKHCDDTDLTGMLNSSLLYLIILNLLTLFAYHFLFGLPGRYNYIQFLSIISVFIIYSPRAGRQALYGSKPTAWKQYLWYIFYPAHIFFLCLLVHLIR